MKIFQSLRCAHIPSAPVLNHIFNSTYVNQLLIPSLSLPVKSCIIMPIRLDAYTLSLPAI